MPNGAPTNLPQMPSRGKMYSDGRIDPYESRKKLPDPTRCPQCKSVFLNGRWTWEVAADPVNEDLCPACKRINDRVPAGVLQIGGAFYQEHRDEFDSLIRNQERLEKERHPLERLMSVEPNEDGLRVETTGHHMARRIGDALKNAFQGDLEMDYLKNEEKVRINWTRD